MYVHVKVYTKVVPRVRVTALYSKKCLSLTGRLPESLKTVWLRTTVHILLVYNLLGTSLTLQQDPK